ncbi:MAG: ABC transporter permease [Bifidobacteriaceae bacterium]|jgi:ABC-type transport system involved in multi-copper enzyme maturation permease subunit|nr:ABC transporter permease [Bifidobacteriaceae bacterium]
MTAGGQGAGGGAVTASGGFPLTAAWSGLVRRKAIWAVLGVWLVQALGFGVVLNQVLYRSMASGDDASAETVAAMRESLLPGNFQEFAAGSMPFYGAAMALALGVLAVGGEYRAGTVRLLYTQGPGRRPVLGAQLVALAGMTGLMTLATYAVDYAGLAVAAAAQDWPIAAPPLGGTLISLGSSWLVTLAYGLLGAALAVLTRGTTLALAGGLAWALGLETVLIALGGQVGWLNGPAHGLLGGATSNLAVANGAYPWWPNTLDQSVGVGAGWAAAGVLAAWAVACAAVALIAIKRRDI